MRKFNSMVFAALTIFFLLAGGAGATSAIADSTVTVTGVISNPYDSTGNYTIYVFLLNGQQIAARSNFLAGQQFSFQIPSDTQVQFDVYENPHAQTGNGTNIYGGWTVQTFFAQNSDFNLSIPQPNVIQVNVTDFQNQAINGLSSIFVDNINASGFNHVVLEPSNPNLDWQVDGQHSIASTTSNSFSLFSYSTTAPRQFAINNSAGQLIWTSASLTVSGNEIIHACVPTPGTSNPEPQGCSPTASDQMAGIDNSQKVSTTTPKVTTSQVASLSVSESSVAQGGTLDINYEVLSPTTLNNNAICSLSGPNNVNLSAIASKVSGSDTDASFKATIAVPSSAPSGAYSVVCSIPYNTLGQGGLYTYPTAIQVGTPIAVPSPSPSSSQVSTQTDSSGDWARYLTIWSATAAKAEALLNSPVAKLPAMSLAVKTISGDLSFQFTTDFLMRNTQSLLVATNKLSADLTLAQAEAAPLLKKGPMTIVCIKGHKSETLTGISPKCPTGFKIKS